ncbi:MAG: glycosyltransferase [Candidatus Andersenbacteria bacterium]
MRIALVHDYLTQFGGAERVLEALMELFPNAPVFTLVYDKDRLGNIDERRLRPSFLQRLPGTQRSHRYFPLALMPLAIEQFNLKDFDVILSATHSFSKGIIHPSRTLHISYCFTPTRYAWDDSHKYVREFSRSTFFQKFAPLALSYIRQWDYYASQRVDCYVTLSHHVARRIKKYYNREAVVVYPPVDVKRFAVSSTDKGYYLVVSRMLPYKRVDLAVAACEKLGRILKVVGTGPEFEDLRRRRGQHTEFLGFVPDEELPALYAGAKALLFPQEEDFGITPLEAAASGKPTIAYRAGGAVETVVEGVTGIFFEEQTPAALVEAIVRFESQRFDPLTIRSHAEKFDRQRFLDEMRELVQNEWMRHQQLKVKK